MVRAVFLFSSFGPLYAVLALGLEAQMEIPLPFRGRGIMVELSGVEPLTS